MAKFEQATFQSHSSCLWGFFLLFSIGLHSLQQPKVGLISQFFWQAENRFKNHKGLPMKSVKNNFECALSVRPKIKTILVFTGCVVVLWRNAKCIIDTGLNNFERCQSTSTRMLWIFVLPYVVFFINYLRLNIWLF